MILFGVVLLLSIWLLGILDSPRLAPKCYEADKEISNKAKPPKERLCFDICIETGSHVCTCCGVEHPLIIDGDSVKLGQKVFTDNEIENLKQKDK